MEINFQKIIDNNPEILDGLLEKRENDGKIDKDELASIFEEDTTGDTKELFEELVRTSGIDDDIQDIDDISEEDLGVLLEELDQALDNLGSTADITLDEVGIETVDLKGNNLEKIAEYINGNVNEQAAEDLTVQSLIYGEDLHLDPDQQRELFAAAGIDLTGFEVREGQDENGNQTYYFNNPETNECMKVLKNGDGDILFVRTTIKEGTAVGKSEVYKFNQNTGTVEPQDPAPTEPSTDTTPTEPSTDTTPTEPSTDTTPTEPSTDTTPTEPSTDTTPTEPSTDTTPTEPSTDTTPTEPPTDTTTTLPDMPDPDLGDEVDPVNPDDVTPDDTPPAADDTPPAADDTPPAADDTPPAADDTPPAADDTPPAEDNTGDTSSDDAPCDDNPFTDEWIPEERT